MRPAAQLERLLSGLDGRRLAVVVALVLTLPPLVVLGFAAHLWSTAGKLSSYRPAEPSRLYAAPLELQRGNPFVRSALVADLRSLGYRPAMGSVGTGEFAFIGPSLRIGLRREEGSAEGPGPFAGQTLEVQLGGSRIAELRVAGRTLPNGAAVGLGRPLLHTYFAPDLRECRPVRLKDLPPHVVDAVLAAEDSRFFRHSGVAPVGILRAAWENLRAGEIRQGGSTITQQLVKNLFVGNRRTLGRKVREAMLAMLVEARFGKGRVLEAYLNEIYWGSTGGANLHGLGAAALAYFGKEPNELSLAEAATLAGMIQSPGVFSPLVDPAAAVRRRNWVLRRMAARHFVGRRDARAAQGDPLLPNPLPLAAQRAPWFAAAMASEARRRFDVERLGGTGYRLLSTLSSTEQKVAEQEVANGLLRVERTLEGARRGSPLEAALVSLEPETGRIHAWVGGRDWRLSEFDRVAQARRPAGSVFKPVVYATALADGRLLPWELLHDSPILVRMGNRTWRPRNSDGGFHGEVTPAEALELSLNVPTVRIAIRAGLPRIAEVAGAMGIGSPLEVVPALALGACEVTPLEMATVYGTLASSGRRTAPWGLESIVDSTGESLVGEAPPTGERVIPAESAYLVTSMLRGVLDRGTGWSARSYGVRGGLAGKTGTTDDRRDNWFAGYSGDRVTVVWVGYDDNRPTRLSGSRGALPLWSRFVSRVEPAGGWEPISPPPGFLTVELDPTTGLLATPLCPRRVREELPAWRAPLRECDVHQPQQLAEWSPNAPEVSSGDSLSDFIARSRPEPPPARVHDDVTRMFGQGNDVRMERGSLPAGTAPPSRPEH